MTRLQPDHRRGLPCPSPNIEQLIDQLLSIRQDILQKEASNKNLSKVHPHYQKSARNLMQYLALRLHDVRDLQVMLSDLGLSSMSRAERKVQAKRLRRSAAPRPHLALSGRVGGQNGSKCRCLSACSRQMVGTLPKRQYSILAEQNSSGRMPSFLSK